MILSVIIPTKNRCYLLENLLFTITQQTLEVSLFEVIIIDNGSTDKTKEIVKNYEKKIHSLNYFYDSTPGLHVGRHLGLKHAAGEILVYLDDDVELFPEHLESVLRIFEVPEVVLVGGKNLPKFELNPPFWLENMWKEKKIIAQLSIIDLGKDIHEINPNFVWGCNFSIRKSILIEAGGFHPDAMPEELIHFRGDGESCITQYIDAKNYKALYHPAVSVYHFVPNSRMSEEYFCKRMYQQGISDSYTILRKYAKFSDLEARRAKKLTNATLLDEKMYNAYLDGYIYHQQECKHNVKLMEWVLKDRYYD